MLFDALDKKKGRNTETVFVLFSGHNERAVIALSRFFEACGQAFVIVCANGRDVILQTSWIDRIIFSRLDPVLDVALFENVLQAVRAKYGIMANPIYCPTTEFMNQFVIHKRSSLQQLGWRITLPAAEVYAKLTSKASSPKVIKQLIGVGAPSKLKWDNVRVPCVLKPNVNADVQGVNYPFLCRTTEELNHALLNCNQENWFAQSWVDGQSYYLCAYIATDGNHAHFWQQNLLQQPGGKSIVLARSVANPGVSIEPLFHGLIDMGYYGPFMMEVIRDKEGCFHYIEINPRFWGPLQLALDACPNVLRLFLHDAGVSSVNNMELTNSTSITHWYAWQKGAQLSGCHRYPALSQIELTQPLQALLEHWDVYAKSDTQMLHGKR